VPVGIALGRTLWQAFATQLDVVPHAAIPVGLLVAVVALAPVVANASAPLPAQLARRVRPAAVLRAE
jgi:hypothetical protein